MSSSAEVELSKRQKKKQGQEGARRQMCGPGAAALKGRLKARRSAT